MYSCGHDEKGQAMPEYWALLPHRRMSLSSGQCPECVARNRQTTIYEDLERHPELTPMLHEELDGRITCLGWVSPIYEFPKSILEELRDGS